MDFVYFDDSEQREFMRERCAVPGCFDAYSLLVSGAARADMFRVAYMYFEGGFWFDADVKAGSLSERCGIPRDDDAGGLFLVREPKRGHVRFMVIGGYGHPILKANIFRQIANVVDAKRGDESDRRSQKAGALTTTGPFTLGRTLCDPFEFATPADLVEDSFEELRAEAVEIGRHCSRGYFTGLREDEDEELKGNAFSRAFGTDRMTFRYDACQGYWHRPGARGLSYQLMLKAMNVTHHLQTAA